MRARSRTTAAGRRFAASLTEERRHGGILISRPARGRRVGPILALVAVVPFLAGASYKTPNFTVEAPTADAAKRIGDHAEACRKSIAVAWLGREMPAWPVPCPIRVKLTGRRGGRRDLVRIRRGPRVRPEDPVEGRLDRILASALPHEVTHTIFAAYFGGPMPRWADEGASLLSEDEREKQRHDQIVAGLLARRGETTRWPSSS